MKEYNMNIFGFAETNLSWTPTLASNASYYGKKVFKQFSLVTCSSDNLTETRHQPRGVCMGATEDITGRILELTTDPTGLGRWTIMLLSGGEGIKIRIITAYK
eukprot:6816873-Ditylum_brightwellii.AAC.1